MNLCASACIGKAEYTFPDHVWKHTTWVGAWSGHESAHGRDHASRSAPSHANPCNCLLCEFFPWAPSLGGSESIKSTNVQGRGQELPRARHACRAGCSRRPWVRLLDLIPMWAHIAPGHHLDAEIRGEEDFGAIFPRRNAQSRPTDTMSYSRPEICCATPNHSDAQAMMTSQSHLPHWLW